MANITAKDVMQFRERTGVSMMACKQALTEAEGNEEKAIEILRKKGITKAAKKANRETGEGAVDISGRAIVKISCETDFVAKNDDFKSFLKELTDIANKKGTEEAEKYFEKKKSELVAKLGENIVFGGAEKIEGGDNVGGFKHFNNKIGAIVTLKGGSEEIAKDIAMHIVAINPEFLSPDEIEQTLIDKEHEIWNDELKQSGKPKQIWDKILMGKEKKFKEERALLTQKFVKDDKKTVEAFAKDNSAEIIGFIRLSA